MNKQIDPEALAQAQALLNPPKPAAFADAVAAAPSNGIDVHALIADARQRLIAAGPDVPTTKAEAEAPDAELVNTLVANAEELKRVADTATKQRDEITALLADLTRQSGAAVLTVNKAPVFELQEVTSRVLNQSHVKSLFPDIPENSELWTDQTQVKRLYKR